MRETILQEYTLEICNCVVVIYTMIFEGRVTGCRYSGLNPILYSLYLSFCLDVADMQSRNNIPLLYMFYLNKYNPKIPFCQSNDLIKFTNTCIMCASNANL